MLLAPDPIIIDRKFVLKLKKGHYANIDCHSGLYFSIFYIKVKILLLCLFLIILYNKRKKVSIFFYAFLIPMACLEYLSV